MKFHNGKEMTSADVVPSLKRWGIEAKDAYEVTVPKSWGKFLAFSNNNLLLEAPDGWRIVDVEGKAPEYPKIKALIHWQ